MMHRGNPQTAMSSSVPQEAKAAATKMFERFFAADTFEATIASFQQMVGVLGLSSGNVNQFYPTVRQSIHHNSAQSLFRLIDEKRKNPVYKEGTAAAGLTNLIVGCGPCGLRTAIEAQLMGAKVVMVEKRRSFTRNNVLHIWPFVIEDLKLLGCKVFFPKFCTGSMNHISIRRLQAVLVKIALLLGVEVHLGVGFTSLEEPNADGSIGWRVRTTPDCAPVNNLDVDVLVGAEGKRVTVPGFPRKEFRGKLAIAITANFVNNNTTAEAVVEEISGVAFVYKQDFFNALYDELGIALENIVYYKDETHYFVMTTKKHSLLTRDVLKKDYKDPLELLHPNNVNKSALMDYIRDTCDFCTDYQLPNLKFALNHHGEPDVALFDFTSMFAARNSLHVKERRGRQLMSCLVGDGLLEPFWPTGTGCARGFLGAFDACWAMNNWASGEKSILQVIAEREAIFKMLAQTTPENISKEFRRYNINPASRYTHVDYRLMAPQKVMNLYDSDRAENGWKPPLADHRGSFQAVNSGSSIGGGAGIQTDLNYLDLRAREISRNLEELNPNRKDDGHGYHSLRAGEGLSNLVGPNKPSIMDKRAPRTAKQPSVSKLTDEARSVLMPGPGDDSYKRNSAEPVGRLTQDQMAVLMASGGGAEGTSPRKGIDVGRLTQDQLALLTEGLSGGSLKRSPTDPSVGRLSADQMAVLSGQKEAQSLRPADYERVVAERRRQMQEQKRREEERQEAERRRKAAEARKKAAPRPPPPDLEIVDGELDDMLVQLETDDDFQRLSDNEKMAWLESLFYLDTGGSSRGRNLHHVPQSPPKENRNLSINNTPQPPALKPVNAAQRPVNAAQRRIQRAASPPKPKSIKPSQAQSHSEAISTTNNGQVGVNENLISLAQSFFKPDPKAAASSVKKPNQGVPAKPIQPVKPLQRQGPKPYTPINTDKARLSLDIASTKLTPTSPVPERAFFEPASPSKSVTREDEDDFASSPSSAPLPPVRSDKNRTAMLKLIQRTTDIMKN